MKKGFFLIVLLLNVFAFGQEKDSIRLDSISKLLEGESNSIDFSNPIQLDPLLFTAKPPFTAKNISSEELEKKNLGQDLPYLIKNTPSVVTTSDAGTGVGYTSMRIRGSDQTRINVTLNGVPLNEGESQNVFWVDLPDLSSSADQIIIQRGVGTSTNGSAAFGASVNIETEDPAVKPFVEGGFSYGSFNTQKYTMKAGTGKFAENWYAEGRISKINSDGYIDRSTSDLFSYNASLMFKNEKRKIWFTTFGGKQETYQAWNGIDKATLESDRTYNPAGEIYDDDGNVSGFYDNQIDHYNQDHYQLHYDESFGGWDVTAALHYTYGRGYYEEYKNDADLSEYKLDPGISDLIRRQWLDNHFYGGVFNVKKRFNRLNLLFGGSINRYDGNHFGRVIKVIDNPNQIEKEYYFNNGIEDEQSFYLKGIYEVSNFEFFADLQYRRTSYKTSALNSGVNDNLKPIKILDEQFNFINPKAGITYKAPLGDFYLSYALGHREPNRSDYMDNDEMPEAETLHDFELGFRKDDYDNFQLNTNLYYMYYENQLVMSGNVNDVGAFIRENSGKSYRAGIEIDAAYHINNWLNLFGNTTLSINKNKNWSEEINGELVEFGNTEISFSPNVIANAGFELKPIQTLSVQFTSKFVSDQYMSNSEYAESKLDAYFVSDILLRFAPKIKALKKISFSLLINNVFDKKYENNGYYYNYYDGNTEDTRGLNHNPYYYPQAGINVLGGVTIGF